MLLDVTYRSHAIHERTNLKGFVAQYEYHKVSRSIHQLAVGWIASWTSALWAMQAPQLCSIIYGGGCRRHLQRHVVLRSNVSLASSPIRYRLVVVFGNLSGGERRIFGMSGRMDVFLEVSKCRGNGRRHVEASDDVHRLSCSRFSSRFRKFALVAIVLQLVSGMLRVWDSVAAWLTVSVWPKRCQINNK